MTYGLGIKGKDPEIGDFIVIASDSMGVNKITKECQSDYKKILTIGGKTKYFITTSGHKSEEEVRYLQNGRIKLKDNSYSIKALEDRLIASNKRLFEKVGSGNRYIVGTSNLELCSLNIAKNKLEKSDNLAFIGSGKISGEVSMLETLDQFKNNPTLQQAIYSAFESQKYSQESNPNSVGGHVDLAIQTPNNFSMHLGTIELDNLYDPIIAKGKSQQITANHILGNPANATKLMQNATQIQKQEIANQIAMSQNPQIAATVINNLNLDKTLQEKILPAILNSENIGYMKFTIKNLHPSIKDEVINEIKQRELVK